MSDFDWIRLICRLLDVLERRLVPWSMYCAGALAVGVRSLPEKFRFRPPAGQSFLENLLTLRLWCGSWLWRLIGRPAGGLLSLVGWFCRIRNWISCRLPSWALRFMDWFKDWLIDAVEDGAGQPATEHRQSRQLGKGLETLNHYGGFSCKILPLNQLGNSFAMVDTP